jgi:hypothetical protein
MPSTAICWYELFPLIPRAPPNNEQVIIRNGKGILQTNTSRGTRSPHEQSLNALRTSGRSMILGRGLKTDSGGRDLSSLRRTLWALRGYPVWCNGVAVSIALTRVSSIT